MEDKGHSAEFTLSLFTRFPQQIKKSASISNNTRKQSVCSHNFSHSPSFVLCLSLTPTFSFLQFSSFLNVCLNQAEEHLYIKKTALPHIPFAKRPWDKVSVKKKKNVCRSFLALLTFIVVQWHRQEVRVRFDMQQTSAAAGTESTTAAAFATKSVGMIRQLTGIVVFPFPAQISWSSISDSSLRLKGIFHVFVFFF